VRSCGAITHKAKDCVERPRAKGARLTGADIAADEAVQTVALDYEGKHDRYNGYDPAEYARVVERFDAVEALKAQRHKERELKLTFKREAKARQRAAGGTVSDDSDDDGAAGAAGGAAGGGGAAAPDSDDDDDEKLGDAEAAEFGQVTRRVRTAGGGASSSVRNLRIREDTAKYLLNLDVASAHYDPKTRSMREDPTPHAAGDKLFSGDNAYRRSGDAARFDQLAVHAWEAAAHGQAVHAQAAPSAAEALFKQFKAKKEALTSATRQHVLARYGDAAAGAPPEGLLLGQSEAYAEFDASGRLLRGSEAAAPKSRFEEDVFPGNHTSVWGSFWLQGSWGFACCRSHVRASYCTGAAGRAAAADAGALMAANVAAKEARRDAADAEAAAAEAAGTGAAAAAVPRRVTWGSDVPEGVALDPVKLAAAVAAEAARERVPVVTDERKRGYNSLAGGDEPTEEEMEAWRLKRAREDDPSKAPGAGTDGYDFV
jgi:pre-mRNA-processing factor SLU7